MSSGAIATLIWALPISLSILLAGYWHVRHIRRGEFIRTYNWPRGLLDKLPQKYPQFTR